MLLLPPSLLIILIILISIIIGCLCTIPFMVFSARTLFAKRTYTTNHALFQSGWLYYGFFMQLNFQFVPEKELTNH